MVQVLYSIAAIMLLGITVLNINVKIHGTQDRMMFSELALEMTSIGAETLNEIGRLEYDQDQTYGQILPADGFDEEGDFGTGPCDPQADYYQCFTINDMHEKAIERTVERVHGGTTYDVTYNITDLEVCYADVAPPHACNGGTKTYAKRVVLHVSTPSLLDADGDPIEVPMSRVYMYPNF